MSATSMNFLEMQNQGLYCRPTESEPATQQDPQLISTYNKSSGSTALQLSEHRKAVSWLVPRVCPLVTAGALATQSLPVAPCIRSCTRVLLYPPGHSILPLTFWARKEREVSTLSTRGFNSFLQGSNGRLVSSTSFNNALVTCNKMQF